MNEIPELSRLLVRTRAHQQCERCRCPAPNGHWHHRRSRRVQDEHTHCPCNGVLLCPACHRWAHGFPGEAREKGFLVSQFHRAPSEVPVTTPWGRRTHTCTGGFTFT